MLPSTVIEDYFNLFSTSIMGWEGGGTKTKTVEDIMTLRNSS